MLLCWTDSPQTWIPEAPPEEPSVKGVGCGLRGCLEVKVGVKKLLRQHKEGVG